MLNCVTVTGADDSVRPSDLAALAAEFPFVEFGILFKGDRGVRPREIDLPLPNRPRFPSFDWMLDLLCHVGPDNHLALSCHLCGQATRDFLEGTYLDGPQPINRHFRRCQVNTHGVIHDFHARRLRETVRKMTIEGQRVIFQYDGVNTEAMLSCKGRHVHDEYGDADFHVDALYDYSHGAGILPPGWSHPLAGTGIPCGFAGGLSPENVAREIERILAVAGDSPFWIDAETHLRSDDGRRFDLDRVRLFLEAASPYVDRQSLPG
jgi:hypothetical protein